MGRLASDLIGPVGLELARAEEQLPGEHGMPGGARFELKWDGFRAGVVWRDGEVRLWSRNGKYFTAKFPDIQAALEAQLTTDCVLDGELVVWTGDRLDFDALQQRMVNTAGPAAPSTGAARIFRRVRRTGCRRRRCPADALDGASSAAGVTGQALGSSAAGVPGHGRRRRGP